MRVHLDKIGFPVKPSGTEIAHMKYRLTDQATILDLSVDEIVFHLCNGQTIQPGVTPFTEESMERYRAEQAKKKAEAEAKGKRFKPGLPGTRNDDWTDQTLFMLDMDNKEGPTLTPEDAVAKLAEHNLPVAFAYPTFSAGPDNLRYRLALVSAEAFTDRDERDMVQKALCIFFRPQADQECKNADRIFFGTDKAPLDVGDLHATCAKEDLLKFAFDVLTIDLVNSADREGQASTSSTPGNLQAARERLGVEFAFNRAYDVMRAITELIPGTYEHVNGDRWCYSGTTSGVPGANVLDGGLYLYSHHATDPAGGKLRDPFNLVRVHKFGELDQGQPEGTPLYLLPSYRAMRDFAATLPDVKAALPEDVDVLPTHWTDTWQADVFKRLFGDCCRHSKYTGWLVYDGQMWRENEAGALGLSMELTKRQWLAARATGENAGAGDEAANSAYVKLLKAVNARQSAPRVQATLTLAAASLAVDPLTLDADPLLLNTPGGVVDLRTGELLPHDPKYLCTKLTAATPSDEGMELWRDFVDQISGFDKELAEYHRLVAGMIAVGDCRAEKMILAYGNGGNGKSTYYNALAKVLGDYHHGLPADVLTTACRRNKQFDLAMLKGCRLAIAAELEEGQRLDTSTVKNLASTDPITADRKNRDNLTFNPTFTLVLFTNHLPSVGTMDNGTWDRLAVVPFPARFRGSDAEVKDYAGYLFDHAGGAILQWIVSGAVDFLASGGKLTEPEAVRRATWEYRGDNDTLQAFIEEHCLVRGDYTERSSFLHKHYQDAVGRMALNQRDFSRALEDKGFRKRRDGNGAYFQGLRLRDLAAPDFYGQV